MKAELIFSKFILVLLEV